MEIPKVLGIGFVAGIIIGLLGLGGGILFIPALTLFLGFSQHKAQGTSLAAMIPAAAAGAASYGLQGHGNILAALWLISGSVWGIFLSSYLVQFVSGPALRRLFGLFLIVVACKLVLG